MAAPILTTKLYFPPPQPNLAPRPRLFERLDEGLRLGRKLTLVSAPAGFGKTTLLSDWLSAAPAKFAPLCFAWLSLDEGDNDLVRFLSYLIAAVQQIEPGIGEAALGGLQGAQPSQLEPLLTALVNEIAVIPGRLVLVLDDLHLVDAQPVNDALGFMLQNTGPGMHWVIATRKDPILPLARLRGRRQLTELRVADLRFSPHETAALLNQVMDLHLSTQDIAALERRTEGWVTGLQLAALSLQGREDPTAFIRAFTGSHQFVLDYLFQVSPYCTCTAPPWRKFCAIRTRIAFGLT
jgi:LuxR family maltose regulon positive regulatory protein